MGQKIQKLELTWIDKDRVNIIEPRILIEDPSKSYGDPNSENIFIHGDNLLALRALEQQYSNRVKCIYIDPPYNTGQAFLEYDDGIEHSLWLSLMSERFKILNKLLMPEGTFFIQLNDEEIHYCKVLLDEIFGRQNFINQIALKTKNTAGASGGGEDKRLKKNIEYILIYAKDYSRFPGFNPVYEEENLFELIEEMENTGKSWKYTSVIIDKGSFVEERTVYDGSGDPITVKKYKGVKRTTINKLVSSGVYSSIEEAYISNYNNIFSDTNAQTSIRTRIIDEFKELAEDELLVSSYIPRSGKDKGQRTEHLYISPSIRRVIWLKDSAEKRGNHIFKKEKLGTYWQGFNWNNVNKEGGVIFTGGKKPEALISRVLDLATNEGDIVLDSFLGSGTTAATAHKMRRKWIGIELKDHALTLCHPRFVAIVNGIDNNGITKDYDWKGGGGFKFYTLAPSLIQKDKYGNEIINPAYNANMLAAAMAKQEGFRYNPSETSYWKQGMSSEKDFIFTTTQFVTVEMMDRLAEELSPGESLLICCKSFAKGCTHRHPNITIKKIPQMLLGRCEFGKDDYSFNIVNLPHEEDNHLESDEQEVEDSSHAEKKPKGKSKKQKEDDNQSLLF